MDAAAHANRQMELMQTKAFTAWINSQLKKGGHAPIEDLLVDLQSGVVLCHVVGTITKNKIRGFQTNPRTPAHRLANLVMALETAQDAGATITASPQDVHDMNTKMVLGLIWTLITKFQANASDVPAVRAKLEKLCGEPLANITTDFSDGIRLAKMINNKKPNLINPDALDASKGIDNVGNALHLLEQHFHMPHVLDAADLCADAPDEKAMVTFWPYVINALEGGSAFGDDDDGPRVFGRTSAPSTPSRVSEPAAPSVSYGGGGGSSSSGGSFRGSSPARATPSYNGAPTSFNGAPSPARAAPVTTSTGGAKPHWRELQEQRKNAPIPPPVNRPSNNADDSTPPYGSGGTVYVSSRAADPAHDSTDPYTVVRHSAPLGDGPALPPCASCNRDIPGGEAVTVSGKRYHKTCFTCCKCRQPIQSSFFSIAEGYVCPACEKTLPPEMEGGIVPCFKCGKTLVGSVVVALGKEYHKECFGCAVCHKKFAGNSFFTFKGQPVCEDHVMG